MSSVGVTARIQRQQQRNAGVGTTCGNPMSYRGQDYQKLRDECLRNGSLFEDDHFPAAPSSLGFKELGPNSSKTRGVQWVRPKDMFPEPQFIIGGATRTDICQGSLGDCWLLAAIASLTLNEKLLARVAPSDQSFDDDYAGIFHFQFWQYGEWVDVVIDDRLPVKAGELVFVHSVDNNEFWGALLEKAYAKLNGSYEALSGGSTSEGFEDFTGGVTESFDLDKPPRNLWTIMQKATQRGSLMGCSINISNTSDMEAVTSRKLVKGHAYSVTGVDEVHYNGQTVRLVRTRNPWGQVEWTGAWSDSSALWDDVYEGERDRLQVDFEDGEFWMSFDDWLRQYSRLEICNLTPDTLDDESLKHWHSVTYPGSWVRGSSAGGCRNYPNSFWSNPQYRLRLEEEDDDPEDGEDGCTFVLGLMQKNRRKEKRHGIEMQTIGFAIYEIPEQFVGQPQVKMSKDFFLYHASAARSETFVNTREVSQRFRLPAGEYLVMPSTFEPNQELDFVVRVFSEKLNPTDVMDDEVEIKTPEVSEDDDDDIDPSFVAIFEKLAGTDGEISPKELQNILARILRKHGNIKTDGFSIDACRNIVALLDKDCSGKLGLKEFNFLWKRIKTWQQIYKQFDMDNSGAFNSFEMRLALKEAGYQLNDKLTEIIISRYRDDDMTIDFDNFICCLVRLEAMSSMFRVMDQGGEGRIQLNLAQFLNITVIG